MIGLPMRDLLAAGLPAWWRKVNQPAPRAHSTRSLLVLGGLALGERRFLFDTRGPRDHDVARRVLGELVEDFAAAGDDFPRREVRPEGEVQESVFRLRKGPAIVTPHRVFL